MNTSEIIASKNKGILKDLIPSRDLPIYGKSLIDPAAEVFQEPIKQKISITKTNGKWLINGNPYEKISEKEKIFFDEFIIAMKWDYQMMQHDEKLKKHPDDRS